jgi:N5-(cytidine 5'-diphosphoramidyl)-L-glutamine hydrolase
VRTVAITQRVAIVPEYAERRDCLDQEWPKFLQACGLLPLALPNVRAVALALCERAQLCGLILTGGNDLVALGGDAPERDEVEAALLSMARQRSLPVVGVCRGMQLIQHTYGVPLQEVDGHVCHDRLISVEGRARHVNSYHRFAARRSCPELQVWAAADDGVVKAIRHNDEPVTGIMWHPERCVPFAADDIALFRRVFEVEVD